MTFEVRQASFHYPGGRPLIQQLSFSVESGEILAVLGPNGAGKTTLLRCMTGLLPWTAGDSFIDGESIRRMPPGRLWRRVSYVPQSKSTSLIYTGEEMALLGRSARLGLLKSPKPEDVQAVRQILRKLDIERLAGKLCSKMSGGELQMVLIARALAAEPGLLVLDEPESNLDFRNQLVILETLRTLAQEQHMACVFNTHYPDHALSTAHKALLVGGDGALLFGSASEVVTESNLQAVFGVRVHIGHYLEAQRQFSSVTPLCLV